MAVKSPVGSQELTLQALPVLIFQNRKDEGTECEQEPVVRLAGCLSWLSIAQTPRRTPRVQLCVHTLAGVGGPCGPRCSCAPLREAATGPPPQSFRFAGMFPPTAEVRFVPDWGRGSRTWLQGALGLGGQPAFRSQGAFWRGRGLSASQLGSWRILDPPGLQGQPCHPLAARSASGA